MIKKFVMGAVGAILCSSAQAVSIFTPTDGTVNFIELIGSSSALLGIFDDSDQTFSGSYLAIKASGDQAVFIPSGTNFTLVNTSLTSPSAFSLSGSASFALAAWSPVLSAWQAPDSVSCTALSASCLLSWTGIALELAVDLYETAGPPAEVPLPSPALLLGFGMFGLAAVARRRRV